MKYYAKVYRKTIFFLTARADSCNQKLYSWIVTVSWFDSIIDIILLSVKTFWATQLLFYLWKRTATLTNCQSLNPPVVSLSKNKNPLMNNSQDNSFIYSTGRYYRLNVMRKFTFDKYTSSLPVVSAVFFFFRMEIYFNSLRYKHKDFDFFVENHFASI